MGEELGFVILWIALFLGGLWVLLRFLPLLIRFYRKEFRQAKDKIIDPEETETMVIKVKKESKKENERE